MLNGIFSYLQNKSTAIVLFDSGFNLIACNEPATELLAHIMAQSNDSGCCMREIKNNVSENYYSGHSNFTLKTSDCTEYHFVMHQPLSLPQLGTYLFLASVDAVYPVETVAHSSDFFDSTNLTQRQKQIAGLISEGYSNQEIAEKLCISQNTVRKHIENIYKILGVKNRISALRMFRHLYA